MVDFMLQLLQFEAVTLSSYPDYLVTLTSLATLQQLQ